MILGQALQRQPPETIRTLAVLIQASGGQSAGQGWVQAYRLSAEQAGRARHKCWQRHKKGAPKAESLGRAGWVLVFTTLAPVVRSAQTTLRRYRGRWQIEIAIKRWQSLLRGDAWRAKARSPLAAV